jgi:hypothetical protein
MPGQKKDKKTAHFPGGFFYFLLGPVRSISEP